MCLVNFHFQDHPIYQLIVVANRDEFYERPTAAAHFWKDEPTILAGRDLAMMGTWLGVTRDGRFAALTNYRDSSLPETGQKSRGEIVSDFLAGKETPAEFIGRLTKNKDHYGGFNVIVCDGKTLLHYNNIMNELNEITPGTHSLSNHSLDTPWPKVVKGKERLAKYVRANQRQLEIEALFNIVSDRKRAADAELPLTGVSLEMERALSPLFIQIPNYGTRCSTVVLVDKAGQVSMIERTFEEGAFKEDNHFTFNIGHSLCVKDEKS